MMNVVVMSGDGGDALCQQFDLDGSEDVDSNKAHAIRVQK